MPERMPIAVRGLIHDDRYCIGITGSFSTEVGLEYVAQADLVIAVGCSLAYHAGGGGQLYPKAKTLQIDIDPVTINQGQEVARHHLRADARLGVEALTAALAVRTTTWRSEAMAARLDKNVVLFDGDGSLMMHVQELETIKRHRMNILIVVINDGAY